MNERTLWTVKRVAQYYDVTVMTIYNWLEKQLMVPPHVVALKRKGKGKNRSLKWYKDVIEADEPYLRKATNRAHEKTRRELCQTETK